MMRHTSIVLLIWMYLALSCGYSDAFVTSKTTTTTKHANYDHHDSQRRLSLLERTLIQPQQYRRMVALTPPEFDVSTVIDTTKTTHTTSPTTTPSIKSFVLTKEECHPVIRIGKNENEKVINTFGIWCLLVSLLTFPIWIVAMTMVSFIHQQSHNNTWDPQYAIFDTTGKLWAKVWLYLTNSYPTISGGPIQPHILPPQQVVSSSSSSSSTDTTTTNNNNNNNKNSPTTNGACLYVANHASWLDIPILCTVLDPVFKFIAKGELRPVPGIGQQLHGGHHILIDRDDRKSQLRTFKESIAWLQKGVPIMAFPEGMRSRDGRLMEFKKGLFSLAVKANVPIVPITLCHTHAIMPTYSFFPVQGGRGKVHAHVGDPIYPMGKTELELEQLVRNEFLAHLPPDQLPLPTIKTIVEEPVSTMNEEEQITIHQN